MEEKWGREGMGREGRGSGGRWWERRGGREWRGGREEGRGWVGGFFLGGDAMVKGEVSQSVSHSLTTYLGSCDRTSAREGGSLPASHM